MVSEFLTMMLLVSPGASSFVVPGHPARIASTLTMNRSTKNVLSMDNNTRNKEEIQKHTWSPQDLTKDVPGFSSIPDDDYIKKYQANPELWPVEFFLIVYRRATNAETQKRETQMLVRKSANSTSKWGVGTGVPATRWLLSTQKRPPRGYQWSESRSDSTTRELDDTSVKQDPRRIRFEASNFPEFPRNGQKSWTYSKIDIREDAFNGPDAAECHDPELEEYAKEIQNELRTNLSNRISSDENRNSWESVRLSVVKNVVDNANSLAAIQGTLRMSGLFEHRKTGAVQQLQNEITDTDDKSPLRPRYVSLGKGEPDPAKLVQSMRIFTMFPQMPDPMPLPSTPPEELQKEIANREARMKKSGRDPHKDRYGRKFTHKSTSNVSNTIHGVYFTLDATDLSGLDEVPALDLFGSKKIASRFKGEIMVQPSIVSDPYGINGEENRNGEADPMEATIRRNWDRMTQSFTDKEPKGFKAKRKILTGW